MVQSYQSPVRVYKYPFELVMAAYERRFPTCEMIPVFLGSDTISETTSSDGAEHIIERRCRLAVEAPYLLKKIIGMEHLLFVQKNSLDRRTRVLKIEAYNESFASRVIINETCQYFVHPEEPNWTCFEQQASLDVKSFFGFESTVEKVAMKQYSLNISKGKEIIEHFINELRKDGITEVPRWVEPAGSSSAEKPAITSGSDQKRSSVRRKKSTSEAPSGVGSRKGSDGTVLAPEEKGATANVGDGEDEEEFHSGDEEEDEEDDGTTELARRRSKLERTFSGDEAAMFKLEAEYIQRCLGKLAPMQESRLVQLKKWVAELQKGKMPKDATLLRFLRARDFHLERAREMLSQSLVWRKQHQVDKILQEYQLPQVVQDYFPGGWHNNYDRDGRPVYLLRLGQMDVKGLMKSVGEEGLFKLTLHICEEGIRMTEEQTRQLGRPISTWTLLVDLEGLNMRHLWRPGVKTLLKIIEVMEANYPETMGRVLIVRAPRVFPVLWTVVGTFIDDNTRCKFVFFSGNDYQQEPGGLSDYIDPEFIPDFLGGSAKTRVNEGGLVPKTQYMTEEEMEKNRDHFPLSEDPIYQSVSIARGQVHEVLINNEDVGSVICWDFDVMKQAVAFSVLRTRVPLPAKIDIPAKVHPDHHDHRSVIEKAWKEGSDYFLVEDVITCHDGESVQGSHTTQHKGTYVLQWRFLDPQAHSFAKNVTELIDSITITHHKAKIMYYHEVLNSQDLKGSMSSLISAHSANSSSQSRSQSCISGSTPSR